MDDLVIPLKESLFKKLLVQVIMGKLSEQNQIRNNNSSINNIIGGSVVKVKRTRKTVPRDSPPQRSSIYRGVTRFYLIYFLQLYFCMSIIIILIYES